MSRCATSFSRGLSLRGVGSNPSATSKSFLVRLDPDAQDLLGIHLSEEGLRLRKKAGVKSFKLMPGRQNEDVTRSVSVMSQPTSFLRPEKG